MKFLVIGDLHIGVGMDDPWHENIRELLMKQVIQYAKDNKIDNLVFLGDIFDDRRFITHRTLELNRKIIIDPIIENDMNAIMIIGNHDASHINTLKPNAITEVFGRIDNFKVVEEFETIKIGDTPIDFVSWMCSDNEYRIRESIKNSQSKYCFGHFELVGFYYYSGNMATEGDDPQFLNDYEFVGSGHYHTYSSNGNVTYLGTPFTITSNDDNEVRGFWEFDTENMKEPKFIKNPKIWNRRITYPFNKDFNIDEIDIEEFRDTRVVVDLNAKPNEDFIKLEEMLESVVNNIKVRNNYIIANAIATRDSIDEDILEASGPLELANEFIDKDGLLSDGDKKELKKKMYNLYTTAISKITDD